MTFITTKLFQCEQTDLHIVLYIYNINKYTNTFSSGDCAKKLINSDSKILKVSEEIKQLFQEIEKLNHEEN